MIKPSIFCVDNYKRNMIPIKGLYYVNDYIVRDIIKNFYKLFYKDVNSPLWIKYMKKIKNIINIMIYY